MTESHSVKGLNGADLPGQSILTPADRTLIMTKHYANRLSFAVLLLFFRDCGRFPRTASEIDRSIVQEIAQQLLIQIPVDYTVSLSGRTVERHRAEIRALLGFREQPSPMRRCLKVGFKIKWRPSERVQIILLHT
jgi:hypothetical protein